MSNNLAIAREVLQQLLSVGPQKGARLKPLLEREFERRSNISFRQAFWEFSKFSAFLAAHSDLCEVTPPGGPGDILVKLRGDAPKSIIALTAPVLPSTRFLPTSIWHAFTNPDPKRRRFYNRTSGRLVHFLEGSREPAHALIAADVAADQAFVEVTPISAEIQAAWMRDFLESTPLPPAMRSVLSNLASIPYSSSVNTAFFAALGPYSTSWRQFRARKVQEGVRAWADRNGVAFDQLVSPTANRVAVEEKVAIPGLQGGAAASARRQVLHELVDALDDGQLDHVFVPAGVLFRLLESRRR